MRLLPILLLCLPTKGVAAVLGGPSCLPANQSRCCLDKRTARIGHLTNVTSADECCAACGAFGAAGGGCGAYCFYLLDGAPACNLFRHADLEGGGYFPCSEGGASSHCISGQTGQPPVPAPPPPPARRGAKNLLYFMVDDLRTALGARHPHMALTPHLDRLASEGATFTHAYCNHAVCAPSRDSFMV